MDFGGGQKPPRLLFRQQADYRNVDENDPTAATTTSKRQRSTEDNPDHLLQQPPQTRRMIGMGLGFPGSGSSGSSASSSNRPSPLFSTSNVAGLVASTPPAKLMIGRGASIGSTSDSSSSSISKRSGSSLSVLVADSEEIEDESHDEAEKIGAGGFSSTRSKNSNTSKSPEVAAAVGHGEGSRRRNSSDDPAYPVEKDDVDEHELGHRLSYLQMRGYDQALLDVMDEGILEESSDDYASASELGYHDNQVDTFYTGVEISYDVRDQPAVVTPERL